jgi:hypothetical protein
MRASGHDCRRFLSYVSFPFRMFWFDADVLSILARHGVLVSWGSAHNAPEIGAGRSQAQHTHSKHHIIKAQLWIKRTTSGCKKGSASTPFALRLWRAQFQDTPAVARQGSIPGSDPCHYQAVHQRWIPLNRLSQITDDGRPMSRSHRRVADETLERGGAPTYLHHMYIYAEP